MPDEILNVGEAAEALGVFVELDDAKQAVADARARLGYTERHGTM